MNKMNTTINNNNTIKGKDAKMNKMTTTINNNIISPSELRDYIMYLLNDKELNAIRYPKWKAEQEAESLKIEERDNAIKFLIKKNKNAFKRGKFNELTVPKMIDPSRTGHPSTWEFGGYNFKFQELMTFFEMSTVMYHYRKNKWGIESPEMWYYENCHIKHINFNNLKKMINPKEAVESYALNGGFNK